MRTSNEMIELVLNYAKNDERVRAVGLNGSRTNPNAPKDMFQDFDIVYLVTDMNSFVEDQHWIDVFGERIIMQTPENMSMFAPELGGRFSYLMLFTDGNRIDLTLVPIEEKDKYCKEDKLTVILMDKDNCLPELQPPTDVDYWAKRPSAEFFSDCCNEFWWVSTYVAKGLWRREILYAHEHLNNILRPMLLKMLEWKVGIENSNSVSIGKCGKYLEKYLSEKCWHELLSTYASGSYEDIWRALIAMINLFRSTSKIVADRLGYEYSREEDERVTTYLEHVRQLSPNATEIY
ncbi:aminoglycoside 6-adenylyltransferase [Psychrobacillus sp. INOP01]|uniref:aminoglycoside 6-adenylyltransferase n=1 Tax=Psychrobacillus sp. INOP01 TaxID=2829187 RepID=UPI001BA98F57|nr:aminoglycoside 6-adenylyltransferase [Psychrobacillus sp. INOP01]QUG43762.1 aminoglycoside 6-adenylyltransferase [Psychrobacillus sp. INOP01]